MLRELTDGFKQLPEAEEKVLNQLSVLMEANIVQHIKDLELTWLTLDEAIYDEVERRAFIKKNPDHPACELPDQAHVSPEMLLFIITNRTAVTAFLEFEKMGLTNTRLNLLNVQKYADAVTNVIRQLVFEVTQFSDSGIEHEIKGYAGYILGVVTQLT